MRLLGPTRARARSKIEVASLPNAFIALDTMSPSSADSRPKLAHIGLNLPRGANSLDLTADFAPVKG